jgi:hypothetical protein
MTLMLATAASRNAGGLEAAEWLGESLPVFSPDCGQDQFTAFLGTDPIRK